MLRAETFERIQKENLELTRSHLELARVRRQIGISGPAEVYRWESQIATTQRSVIDANAQRNAAEINVNRFLHPASRGGLHHHRGRSLRRGVGDTTTPASRVHLSNKRNFSVLRDFMTEDGLSTSPELAELDAAIAARQRALSAAGRAHWLPTIALQGSATRNLSREGAGSQFDPIGGDASWNVGIRASLPLFSGGGNIAAQARARQELQELENQRAATRDGLEARIRAALHTAGASYAGITLSEDAAVAAARNLELVEDAYGRGVVSILDLLDAQNAAIVAEEAANAVYDFLLDLMEVERAIGKSYLFAPEQREDWFRARHELHQCSPFFRRSIAMKRLAPSRLTPSGLVLLAAACSRPVRDEPPPPEPVIRPVRTRKSS